MTAAAVQQTWAPPRVAAPPAARMAAAAARVIDQTPDEAIAGETLAELEQLRESVDAALRAARRRARHAEREA